MAFHRASRPLGNGITTDEELSRWCTKNVPGFRGVIDRSRFKDVYAHLHPGDSLIINLDPNYSRGGTHWVAFRVSREAPIVYYKDSFGAPPPEDIVKTVSEDGRRGLIYGNRINQKIKEDNCGKRSAEFLRDMAHAAAKKEEIELFEKLEK